MKKGMLSLKLIIISVIILLPTSVFAIDISSEGFKLLSNASGFEVDVWGNCKKVDNTTGEDIFIPTKTEAEWNAFLEATLSIPGLAIDTCVGCGAGLYFNVSCVNAGAGYYSPADDDIRYSCLVNYYGTSTTNSSSVCDGACPNNSSSPAGSDNIDDCDGNAGYYGCADGTCNLASIGYYSPNDNDGQILCLTNSTSPAGSDDISDCIGSCGYYSCADGTCNVAGAGYYSLNLNDTRSSCAANYYGAGTTNCTSSCDGACPNNSSSPAGSDNINDCDGNCGYYDCADGTCNVAGDGYYSPNDNDTRSVCAANYYGAGTTNCTSSCDGPCPTNSTSPAGSDSRYDCDGNCGYYSCGDGTCNVAGDGYYSPNDNDSRYACAANYYGTSTTNCTSSCNGACPTNSTSPSGSDSRYDCDGNCGYYSCGDGTCNVAGAGYYSPNDNDSRYSCAANYYGTSTTNCTSSCNGACPVHSTSPAGSDSIWDCDGDGGWYGCGDGTCNEAGAGYYSPNDNDSRYTCPDGKTSPVGSDSVDDCVLDCADGEYDNNGTCTACTAGFYCSDNDRYVCSENTYSNEGASECTACPIHSTSPAQSDNINDCDGDGGWHDCDDGTCNETSINYYSQGNNDNQYSCPTNSSTGGNTGSDERLDCYGNAGYWDCGDDGICNVAEANYYSPNYDDDRHACDTYSSTGGNTGSDSSDDCNCDAGRYLKNVGGGAMPDWWECSVVEANYHSPYYDDSRYACPTNSSSPSGSDDIDDCKGNAGWYSCADGTCNKAEVNHYSPNDDNWQTHCPVYSSSPEGSDERLDCDGDGGWYDCGDDGLCNKAEVNYYSPNDDDTQTGCPANSSSPEGSDNINDCDGNGGYYSCADGTCNAAGAGYYSPNDNDSRYLCSIGYYGSSSYNSTSSCNGGCGYDPLFHYNTPMWDNGSYYCSSSGSTSRSVPSTGYYATGGTSSARTSQTQCQAGYYCTFGLRRDCPSGEISLAGSDSESDCFAMDDNPNYFSFNETYSAWQNQDIYSNTVTITGINVPVQAYIQDPGTLQDFGVACDSEWTYGLIGCLVESGGTVQIYVMTPNYSYWSLYLPIGVGTDTTVWQINEN